MKLIISMLSLGFLICGLTISAYPMGSKPKKPTVVVNPTPSSSDQKGMNFSPVYGYTKNELQVLDVATQLSNKLIQSKCFENYMLPRKLTNTKGRTPAQVVEHIRISNLTVPLKMYENYASTVKGYRVVGYPTIYTNRKYHAGSTACARGSNLTHEWAHVLNYGHSSAKDYLSVNYSINGAFVTCCSCEKKSITKCEVKE